MCGIAGFLSPGGLASDAAAATARDMAASIAHRGPDGEGVWLCATAGIALAHRRLSVIDLSDASSQPMHCADKRFVLSFNGEIYNFRALRAELETGGWRFRSQGDTEVVLAACATWGVKKALVRMDGMFAFALWDRRERALVLARDRFGEKPLYYGWFGDTLLFASELKAFWRHPDFSPSIDREAVDLYLRHAYVPAPLSIFRGVRKLEAASWLRVSTGADAREAVPRRYWDLRGLAEAGAQAPFRGDDREALDRAGELVAAAVASRLQTDVPLGAFLSGGIDSSLVVAQMQAAGGSSAVKTFTVGFAESEYDEAAHAAAVASHLGTDHTEIRVTPAQTLDVVPALVDIYDEPFADSSQIPTYLISGIARRQVTVCLTGDAGDEVFGGYNRYRWGGRLHDLARLVPAGLRRAGGAGVRALPPAAYDALFRAMRPLLPSRFDVAMPGDKAHKVARLLSLASPEEQYLGLVTQPGVESLGLGAPAPSTLLYDRARWPRMGSPVAQMMALDMATYLPDDILAKVDRASMAVSLETRVPFLAPALVEFALSLPMDMRIRQGRTKWVARRLLERHVPQALFERPKMGFAVPIDAWLRGPLRDWADTLLDPARLESGGLVSADAVRRCWREHLSGRRNWQALLWSVLQLEAWRERWGM